MKKMYYVVAIGKNDEWDCGKFESKEEAIKEARLQYDRLTSKEKKEQTIEIRDYVADVEAEDCDNFDYDTVDWGYIVDWGNSLKDVVNMSEKEVRQWADDRLAYNQCPVTIVDIIDNCDLWKRNWWGCLTGIDECEDPIEIGNGFYSDWEIV